VSPSTRAKQQGANERMQARIMVVRSILDRMDGSRSTRGEAREKHPGNILERAPLFRRDACR